jgi:hypothetical protein
MHSTDPFRRSCIFLLSRLSLRSRTGTRVSTTNCRIHVSLLSMPAPSSFESTPPTIVVGHPLRNGMNESRTHFAEILRYMLDGVKNSAGIDENTGTRFGGFGELTAAAKTSRMVSSDGWTTSCKGHTLSSIRSQGHQHERWNIPVAPYPPDEAPKARERFFQVKVCIRQSQTKCPSLLKPQLTIVQPIGVRIAPCGLVQQRGLALRRMPGRAPACPAVSSLPRYSLPRTPWCAMHVTDAGPS